MSDHAPTPAPWSDRTTPLIRAGDPLFSFHGELPKADCRMLVEVNYQRAMQCVNAHDDLLEACKRIYHIYLTVEIEIYCDAEDVGWEDVMDKLEAAIAKAEGKEPPP